ncbi:MAG: phosphotransferase [Saprospiraceae bacterium]|nr:phosphotransferase [Saprospiraceae bacterium]
MQKIISDIPLSNNWKIVRLINEGWSADKKYYIKDNKGSQYVLRISRGQSYKEESLLYTALRDLGEMELPVSKLLSSGLCNDGKNTFRLFSWIEGVDLRNVIGDLSEEQQYEYGYDSGKILKKIHEIGCPSNRISWSEHYHQKIDKKIERFRDCGITFPNSERLIDYIQEHRSLIEQRPQSFHHGDYHLGNMVITPDKQLAVIDFNRLDFGDPWEEFNRIPWSANKSISFARGQINGYFKDEVPKGFFELMALYIGVNQIGSIPWAIPYGPKELEILLDQTNEVLEWYDNFDRSMPQWY